MKPLRRALQNGPSPMAIRHSWQKLFKVFTAPTQRERSIVDLLTSTSRQLSALRTKPPFYFMGELEASGNRSQTNHRGTRDCHRQSFHLPCR